MYINIYRTDLPNIFLVYKKKNSRNEFSEIE